ncbi:MAG: hypothetical protein AAGA11_16645 [Pseudomonadota bacterium]
MARPDPINALRHVADTVAGADLLTPLSHINQASRPEDAVDFVPILLSSYGEFHSAAKQFNRAEKQVCEVMKLHGLFDEALWRGLINARSLSAEQLISLHELHGRVHFAVNYVPDLVALSDSQSAAFSTLPEGKSVLALGVRPFEAADGVDTSQLTHALHGLELLYVASCAMSSMEPQQLVVQNWRGHPMPMISILIDKEARPALDRILTGLARLVGEHAGALARHSLTDILLDSDMFLQLDAVAEAGVLDADGHEDTANLLLDGCLEMLSAGVIPPGLPAAAQTRLDGIAVVAEHELREHTQGVHDAAPADDTADDPSEDAAIGATAVGVAGAHAINDDGVADQDSVDGVVDGDAYDDHEDDPIDDAHRGAEIVPFSTTNDYDDEDDLQIVVEMDGEPMGDDIDDEDLGTEPEDMPEPMPMVEPEIVTNKAFKRALKDLKKSQRR